MHQPQLPPPDRHTGQSRRHSYRRAWLCLPTLALGCAGLSAQAHEVWIVSRGPDYAVVLGHDSATTGYDPARVRALFAADREGKPLEIEQRRAQDGVHFALSGKPAVATVVYDGGYRISTRQGAKNLPKDQVPGALSASHTVRTGKAIYAWGPAVVQPQTGELEIVPAEAKAPQAGKPMAIVVRWRGQPLANARIVNASAKAPAVATDNTGRAAVPVSSGRQFLQVSHKEAVTGDPRADTRLLSATLVFDTP